MIDGWQGDITLNHQHYKLQELAINLASVLIRLGRKYPTLQADSLISSAYLLGAVRNPSELSTFQYLDLHSPNNAVGCLSDLISDKDTPWQLVRQEALATLSQAIIGSAQPELLLSPGNLVKLHNEF